MIDPYDLDEFEDEYEWEDDGPERPERPEGSS